MNFQTFLLSVQMRCKPFEPKDQLEHAQIGMITELGELGDLVKRAFVYGKEFDPVNLMEEVGDYLWYLTLFCDVREIHAGQLDRMCEAMQDKLDQAGELGELEATRALAAFTGILAMAKLGQPLPDGGKEGLGLIVGMMAMLLHKHNFTMAQCLDTNDKKLEARTGKAFDAAAILGRDVAAERVILERGAAQ